MKNWIVTAPLDCTGVYAVEAETAEEAKQAVADWDGSSDVVDFCHYSEESLSTTPSEMTAKEDC